MQKIMPLSLLLLSLFSFQALAELPAGLSKDCLAFIHALPKDIEYDFVKVPENRDHPDPALSVPIFYYASHLHSLSKSGIKPIVYFNGGPGSSTHATSTFFRTYLPAQGVPFLYVDQRGTGCSGQYPHVPSTKAGAERLGLYGTRNIVLDAEAVRSRLFPDGRKWSVFGQSYGTAIIHRYITLAPQALEKAFAHGLSMQTDGIFWIENRMLSQKRVAAVYLAKYPKDEEIMNRARSLLPKDYCSGNLTGVTCGPGNLDYLLFGLGFTQYWPALHKSLAKVLTPAGELDFEELKKSIPPGISPEESVEDMMSVAVATRELPGGLGSKWSCKKAVPRLIAKGEDPLSWFHNQCRITLATKSTYDSYIEQMIAEDYLTIPALAHGLQLNPNLELHLYSGELDTFSPREGCAEVVKALGSRIFYTNFMNTGHDWSNEPKIWEDLKRN